MAWGCVGVLTHRPYEVEAAAQEVAENFFLLFELDLTGFTLPEFVRHPMELEGSLKKNRKKGLNTLTSLLNSYFCG